MTNESHPEAVEEILVRVAIEAGHLGYHQCARSGGV